MLLLTTLMLTAQAANTNTAADAVRAFVNAGDTASVTELKSVLHPDFRVVAQMPSGVSLLDRTTYLSLIEAGKIGGVPRTLTVNLVVSNGDLATLTGTLESSEAHFDSTWTVARIDGTWLVVQDATVFRPVTP